MNPPRSNTAWGEIAPYRPADGAEIYFDDEQGVFVVVGHAAADEVLRGPGWSSDIRRNIQFAEQFGGSDNVPSLLTSMLLFMDAPGHTRMRRLVAPAFTSRRMEPLRPRIEAIVDAALKGVGGVDDFDVLADLAYPIPVAVISEFLDVGMEGAQLIREQTPLLAALVEIDADEEQLRDSADASMTCAMYLLPLLDERRKHPGEDILSALLTIEVDGEQLSLEEVLATVLLLLTAGHETTANLIANGALALLQNRDQLELLRDDPNLIGSAVEEVLRRDPPVRFVGRTAIEDHVIAGHLIRADQPLLIHLAAANRDPNVFDVPDAFDITRTGTRHLAFGAGPHFCLGWALARIEAEVTLQKLFATFPDLGLVDLSPPDASPRWRDSTTFHALSELRVIVKG